MKDYISSELIPELKEQGKDTRSLEAWYKMVSIDGLPQSTAWLYVSLGEGSSYFRKDKDRKNFRNVTDVDKTLRSLQSYSLGNEIYQAVYGRFGKSCSCKRVFAEIILGFYKSLIGVGLVNIQAKDRIVDFVNGLNDQTVENIRSIRRKTREECNEDMGSSIAQAILPDWTLYRLSHHV